MCQLVGLGKQVVEEEREFWLVGGSESVWPLASYASYWRHKSERVPKFIPLRLIYKLILVVMLLDDAIIGCQRIPQLEGGQKSSLGKQSVSEREIVMKCSSAERPPGDLWASEATGRVSVGGRPAKKLGSERASVLFDDEVEEDEEDEEGDDYENFYSVNPIDRRTAGADFNVDKAVQVSDSDFTDFDDHEALRTNEFYTGKSRKPEKGKEQMANATLRMRPTSSRRPSRFRTQTTTTQNGSSPRMKRPRIRMEAGRGGRRRELHNVAASYATRNSFAGPSCALVLSRGLCISHQALEWALEGARRALRFRRPPELNSLELSESTIHSVGELSEMATRILANRLRLSLDEVHFELEQLDMGRTSMWRTCPAVFRSPPVCASLSRFRTHTGRCNNLLAAHLGSANMPFVRLLPADYGDGIGSPRLSTVSRSQLPPARLVALSLHPDVSNPADDHSALYMSWGQLINHDLALASGARDATGHDGSCCQREGSADRVCMPIPIAANDPFYAPFNVRCLDFKRSLAGLRPRCSLGPRTQINTITSFVDASFVYGSTKSASSSLRATRNGLLDEWPYFKPQLRLKPLLPPQLNEPDQECVGRSGNRYCFRSGDSRTNQNIQLVALHTIHTRQHNRLARALAFVNPHWSSRRIYHEARHIHVAQVQHILISEYLPSLLGPAECAKHNLSESPLDTYWDHYDASLNPGISQAFAAAAFRQGHSTVPSQVFRFNYLHEPVRVYPLRQLFGQPWPLFEPRAMDEFLLGLVDAPSQSFDPFVSLELSGHLLQLPNEPFGLDLIAINIQRGRDQGVAGYNAHREWCGLERAHNFEDLIGAMSNESVHRMASLYESVDDIDLFSGGLSEFPIEGAQVGPVFACIIGHQFSILRSADRFWFESSIGPQAFTLSQLNSIKQASLARLICANSDNLVTIQSMALKLAHPILNPRQFCASLPDIDISLWSERPPNLGR